jgi:hypothetical protein
MPVDEENPLIVYEFAGEPCPVDVFGTFMGKTFSFHARWDRWRFVLSEDPAVDAGVLLAEADTDPEWLRNNHPLGPQICDALRQAFVRSGQFGKPGGFDAGYMSIDEAKTIIRSCLEAYEQG